MQRTKDWWSRLDPDERSWLIYFERNQNNYSPYGGDGWLPDDCMECTVCSCPGLSSPCRACLNEAIRIVDKADGKMRIGSQSHS